MMDPRPPQSAYQQQVRRTQDLVRQLSGQPDYMIHAYGIKFAVAENDIYAIHATIALANLLRMRPKQVLELVRSHDPHSIQTSATSMHRGNAHRQREFIMGLSITPVYRDSLFREIVASPDGANIAYPSRFM